MTLHRMTGVTLHRMIGVTLRRKRGPAFKAGQETVSPVSRLPETAFPVSLTLSLTLSDTRVCKPQIRARLGTTAPRAIARVLRRHNRETVASRGATTGRLPLPFPRDCLSLLPLLRRADLVIRGRSRVLSAVSQRESCLTARKLSCAERVYEPQVRACLGTTAQFCKVVVLEHLIRPVVLEHLIRPVDQGVCR